jgi:hypothetical protein
MEKRVYLRSPKSREGQGVIVRLFSRFSILDSGITSFSLLLKPWLRKSSNSTESSCIIIHSSHQTSGTGGRNPWHFLECQRDNYLYVGHVLGVWSEGICQLPLAGLGEAHRLSYKWYVIVAIIIAATWCREPALGVYLVKQVWLSY